MNKKTSIPVAVPLNTADQVLTELLACIELERQFHAAKPDSVRRDDLEIEHAARWKAMVRAAKRLTGKEPPPSTPKVDPQYDHTIDRISSSLIGVANKAGGGKGSGVSRKQMACRVTPKRIFLIDGAIFDRATGRRIQRRENLGFSSYRISVDVTTLSPRKP